MAFPIICFLLFSVAVGALGGMLANVYVVKHLKVEKK